MLRYTLTLLTLIAITLIACPLMLDNGPTHTHTYDASTLLSTQCDTLPIEHGISYHTSPTYYATCTNAYAYASTLLTPTTTPSTIVMDLDETLFSGVGLNEYLYREGLSFSYDRQLAYMDTHVYTLVHGALPFIRHAQSLGYTIVFVTNRKPMHKAPTMKHLSYYGLSDMDVLYRTDVKDKAPRIASLTNVVMTIGDKDNDHIPGITNVFLPNKLY